jgi:hypothetical protein
MDLGRVAILHSLLASSWLPHWILDSVPCRLAIRRLLVVGDRSRLAVYTSYAFVT